MGKKSSDAPDYPKELMARQLDQSEAMGNRYMDMSEQQQDWSQNMWDEQMFPMMQETTGVQTAVMRDQMENARKDRARYEDTYQPIEDDLIKEFQDYDSTGRRNLESGRAQAGVQRTFDSQRANAEQRLASYGVDPSQIRAGAIDAQARTKMALGQAAQGNAARQRVEDVGRSLRAEAINIGRGMPSQVAGAYGQTLNAGNSAMGNMNSTMGQGSNMMGTGQGWGQMAGNQNSSTMSGINNMYSGQLAGHEAGGQGMAALGNIAGQAFGAWAGSGFAEGGGAVGDGMVGSDLSSTPGPNDKIPVTLAQDEYIIPKDVVMRMGTEKLDKLLETTRRKAGEAGGANTNTQPGEMPNEEAPIHGQTMAAEGGGAVGSIAPTAIPAQGMPVNPGWGVGDGSDPFATYHAAAAQRAMQEGSMDMQAAIGSGAAIRENYDDGTGLPGKFRAWKEARDGSGIDAMTAQAKANVAANPNIPSAPQSIGSAEGGGAVGSMPGKYMLTPQEEEQQRLRQREEERRMQQQQQAQGGGGPSPAMMQQFIPASSAPSAPAGGAAGGAGGGAGGGGASSGLAAAAPWAALAAAVIGNETYQNKSGNRPDDFKDHAKEMLTGEVLERDAERYLGKDAKKIAALGNPVGTFKTIKKLF